MGHDSCVCIMTHSCVTWLIYRWHGLFMCDMTYSCETCLIHVRHDSFMCDRVTFMRDTTYSMIACLIPITPCNEQIWVSHVYVICVIRMSHENIWHSRLIHMTHSWLIHMSHSYVTWPIHAWHDSFIRDTPSSYACYRSFVRYHCNTIQLKQVCQVDGVEWGGGAGGKDKSALEIWKNLKFWKGVCHHLQCQKHTERVWQVYSIPVYHSPFTYTTIYIYIYTLKACGWYGLTPHVYNEHILIPHVHAIRCAFDACNVPLSACLSCTHHTMQTQFTYHIYMKYDSCNSFICVIHRFLHTIHTFLHCSRNPR